MKKNQPIDPDTFESAFAEFWESKECDELNWVLFDLIKAAFAAGCRAAGGEPPEYPQKVQLSRKITH